MLGFGFNKDKTRASAERFVQQGRLQNAIAEYDKILKQDPKDLTVLNTVGDLYARLGQIEQAVVFFKLVGDTYASEGFVPKAIAMYKKLTKLSPNTLECLQKLGELYTQQGLYNDARAQFLLIADLNEKEGRKGDAIRAFMKVRELDPENWNVTNRLAKLYRGTGNNAEAVKLLMAAADSLRARNSLDHADEALLNILQMEPNNSRALELRGTLALERGEPGSAVALFEKVPDIDSRPEALSQLLKANLLLGRFAEAEPEARKLLTVHNDCAGLFAYTDKLFATDPKQALAIYEEFSDRLLANDRQNVVSHLRGAVSVLREDIPALEAISKLFSRAGEDSETGDILELIAHASVQNGDLPRARDLYLKLAQLEPANPAHAQNYRQVMVKMGADAAMLDQPVNNFERPFAEPLETDDVAVVTEVAPEPAPFQASVPEDATETAQAAMAGPVETDVVPETEAAASVPAEFSVVPTPPPPVSEAGTVHEIDISAEWETASLESAPTPTASEAQISDLVEEITFYISQSMWSEATYACEQLEKSAPGNRELPRLRALIQAGDEANEPEETIEVAASPVEVSEFGTTQVYDLDSDIDLAEEAKSTPIESITIPPVAAPAPPPVAKVPEPTPEPTNFLGGFVQELDSSLGEEFNLGAAPEKPAPLPPPPPPAPAVVAAPAVLAPPAPAQQIEPAATEPEPQPSMLDDLFQEFKEEMGDTGVEQEDPETHYNLGVAFKEMGLLDEAIGELQKVCQAVERGASFSQTIQAYTWLANCFVEKGVPEASFKWYELALGIARDNESKLAIHYEIAAAYEAAGFRREALGHYMEVYTTNIDYRDVGERIKALRS
jgi:tetratricopeptide (TPR) repeat protein